MGSKTKGRATKDKSRPRATYEQQTGSFGQPIPLGSGGMGLEDLMKIANKNRAVGGKNGKEP